MIVIALAGGALAVAIFAVPFIGGEFMPALEEGNIWMRATLPVDISFEQAAQLATDIRQVFGDVPEVIDVASQLGRPDDGTDPTSFFNAEFLVTLKPRAGWRPSLKDEARAHLRDRAGARLVPRHLHSTSRKPSRTTCRRRCPGSKVRTRSRCMALTCERLEAAGDAGFNGTWNRSAA